ncbi:solute carrier family 22 member 13-like [Tropilaelaps mercedesae]|uniref:Solute carrier family 22 member 13-like n=1 Tax=Tropilaelaps mercedesae TaxID=418985 RepID=A0A1V9XW67_9ACAR|nr:solute carrier family 22 member 13-like [Tropilaelaps mercedesae]
MSVSRVAMSEAYPTVIRAMAISLAAMMSRVGSCVAPFFEELERSSSSEFLPLAVTAGLCFLAALLTLLLNETFGQPLPDNIKNKLSVRTEDESKEGGNNSNGIKNNNRPSGET